MNNGVVLEEEHFRPTSSRIFVSNEKSNRKTIKAVDSEMKKNELISIRDGSAFIARQPGFSFQKLNRENKLVEITSSATSIFQNEKIILRKGHTEIFIRIVPAPPKLLSIGIFDFDEQLLKITASTWGTFLIPLLMILLFAVATKVKVGIRTSSPLTTPASLSAMCNAAVPFTVATANFDPTKLEILFSKSVTFCPTEETKFESMHSVKYSFSLPSNTGR